MSAASLLPQSVIPATMLSLADCCMLANVHALPPALYSTHDIFCLACLGVRTFEGSSIQCVLYIACVVISHRRAFACLHLVQAQVWELVRDEPFLIICVRTSCSSQVSDWCHSLNLSLFFVYLCLGIWYKNRMQQLEMSVYHPASSFRMVFHRK